LGEHEIPIVGEIDRTIRCGIWYQSSCDSEQAWSLSA
jgi:hypothetical protein